MVKTVKETPLFGFKSRIRFLASDFGEPLENFAVNLGKQIKSFLKTELRIGINVMACAVLFLSGCTSLRFKSDFSEFKDQVWDKTQPEFNTVIALLQKDHDEARKYLSTNMPEVVSVHSKYWARGFCVLTYRYHYGACEGHVFCSDGSDFEAPPVEYDDNPIIKDAVRRQLKFVSKRKADTLKKKFEDEELAIATPRKISLGDLVGVKAMTPVVDHLRNAGIWPDHSYTEIDTYGFDFRNEYVDGTIPGLVPFEGFTISGLTVDRKTGGLLNVFMKTHVSIGNIDRFITSTVHTLQAKLHTKKPPQRGGFLQYPEYSYSWNDIETSDGRKLSVSLSYQLSTVFHRYEVLLHVYDSVRVERPSLKFLDSMGKHVKEKRDKDDTRVTLGIKEKQMYELYNRIKNHLVIVQTERGSGSGFVVKERMRCYLYTNEHIVRKAKNKPRAVTLDGASIVLGSFELAKGRDLVRFEIESLDQGLEMSSGLPDINKDVVVFGNSDGAGVVTALNGKIVGIGPKLIEVSAEFVQGNSGSPVLLLDGSVVGIATFAIDASDSENWLKKDTRFNGIRRFALRLEKVDWKSMDWELYNTIVNR